MNNADTFRQIMKEIHPKLTQEQAAFYIQAATHRPCAARTVRSWLNNPECKSSRPCPDWAVGALAKARDAMRTLVERKRQQQQERGES